MTSAVSQRCREGETHSDAVQCGPDGSPSVLSSVDDQDETYSWCCNAARTKTTVVSGEPLLYVFKCVCACVHVFDYFGKTTELFIEPRPDYSVSDFVEVEKYIKYGHFCKVIDIPVL